MERAATGDTNARVENSSEEFDQLARSTKKVECSSNLYTEGLASNDGEDMGDLVPSPSRVPDTLADGSSPLGPPRTPPTGPCYREVTLI